MRRVVLRFSLGPTLAAQHLLLPVGSELLSVGIKLGDDMVSVWALVPLDYEGDLQPRRFYVVGTGPRWALDVENLEHLGTAIDRETAEVWHVFEETLVGAEGGSHA